MPVSPVTPAVRRPTPSRAPCPVSAVRWVELSTLSSRLSANARQRRAFTLLELLVVIGIIAILAGIVLGVGRRASESGKIARAKAEMAALSTALEAYKSQYGDYPQTAAVANDPGAAAPARDDGPGILFNALAGKRGPKSALTAIDGRVLVELAKFALQVPDRFPLSGNTAQLANAFVDPWGHRYLYSYDPVVLGKVLSFEQLGEIPSGPTASFLKAMFHHGTSTSRRLDLSGATYSSFAGPININMVSADVWRVILSSYNQANLGPPIGASLTAKVTKIASGLPGSLGRPFFDLPALLRSNVASSALSVSDPTQTIVINSMASLLTTRSDTFRIRAYGDAMNPATAKIESTAYCEAIVQRSTSATVTGFGQKFVIVYFRWLGPDDV